MPEYVDENLLTDTDADTDLVRNLRSQLRKAATRIGDLESAQRGSSIKQLLTDAKIANPDKVAKFYPSDGEPTKDAVDAWLKGDGSVFQPVPAGEQTTEAPPQAQEQPQEQKPQEQAPSAQAPAGVPPELIAIWQAMQNQEQVGSTAVTPLGADKIRADLQALEGKDFDDVAAAMQQLGTVPIG